MKKIFQRDLILNSFRIHLTVQASDGGSGVVTTTVKITVKVRIILYTLQIIYEISISEQIINGVTSLFPDFLSTKKTIKNVSST